MKQMNIGKKIFLWFGLILLGLMVSGCSSLFGVVKLDNIDFNTAQIKLATSSGSTVNNVTAGGSYQLSVSAYDPETGKIRDVLLSKQVVVSINSANVVNNGRLSSWSYDFNVNNNNIALLEASSLELTVRNITNGSQQTVRYPITINAQTSINLPADRNGNGAIATFTVALLDSNQLGLNQGPLLLLVNRQTGANYITTPNVLIAANGSDGPQGLQGRSGQTVKGGRGTNGTNGQNGGTGGNGGQLTLIGSRLALQSIRTQTNGGNGGLGGAGGLGGVGATEVITFAEAKRNFINIEFMRPLPNQGTPALSNEDRRLLEDAIRKADANRWQPSTVGVQPVAYPYDNTTVMDGVQYLYVQARNSGDVLNANNWTITGYTGISSYRLSNLTAIMNNNGEFGWTLWQSNNPSTVQAKLRQAVSRLAIQPTTNGVTRYSYANQTLTIYAPSNTNQFEAVYGAVLEQIGKFNQALMDGNINIGGNNNNNGAGTTTLPGQVTPPTQPGTTLPGQVSPPVQPGRPGITVPPQPVSPPDLQPHQFMMIVKYYNGLNGQAGLDGRNGQNGISTSNEANLNFDNEFRSLTSNRRIINALK